MAFHNDQRADIPFNFIVSDRSFDLGSYDIGIDVRTQALYFRGPDNGFIALARSNKKAEIPPESKLVFNKYGDTYFLSELVLAGNPNALKLSMCQSEKEQVFSTWELKKVSVLLQSSQRAK